MLVTRGNGSRLALKTSFNV